MKIILPLILLIFMSGCTKLYITYNIVGNSNKLVCDTKYSPEKTVGTSLGASIAATAALSQAGPAENSGAASATTVPSTTVPVVK
jgi:hypothetical protein